MDFSKLKASSGKKSLEFLTAELNKLTSNESKTADDRFWQPTVDKAGNGYAVIRFLPAPPGEDVPYVRMFDHGFQGPGGWYIENSLTTIGQGDPVSDHNSKLWNTGVEANKEIVRKQKRRLHFISNIEVITDPGNPENEGKNFLYKYGKKIFDKINEQMHPTFPGEEAVNPFDFWEGANFKLKIRQVEGYRNYDKSEFDKPSVFSNDDSELEATWKKEYSLKEFLDSKNFKTYEELQQKLLKVLSEPGNITKTSSPEVEPKVHKEKTASKPKEKESVPFDVDEDGDDSLAFFKNLAKDD